MRWYFPNRIQQQDLGATFTIKVKNQVLSDQGLLLPAGLDPPKGALVIPAAARCFSAATSQHQSGNPEISHQFQVGDSV